MLIIYTLHLRMYVKSWPAARHPISNYCAILKITYIFILFFELIALFFKITLHISDENTINFRLCNVGGPSGPPHPPA